MAHNEKSLIPCPLATLCPVSEVTNVKFMCIFPETVCGSTCKITGIFLPPQKKKVTFSICVVWYLLSVLFVL